MQRPQKAAKKKNSTPPTSTDNDQQDPLTSCNKKPDNQSDRTYHPKW